jgi:hypothetical protein
MLIHRGNVALLQEPAQTSNGGWNPQQLLSTRTSDRRLNEGHCKLGPAENLLDLGTYWRFAKFDRPIPPDALKIPSELSVALRVHDGHECPEIIDGVDELDGLGTRSVGLGKAFAINPIAFGEVIFSSSAV